MKTIALLLLSITLLNAPIFAQSTLKADGGKADRSVSRYTKEIDGKRVPSARVILESNLILDISNSDDSIIKDSVETLLLPNGMTQYTLVFYMTNPQIAPSILVRSEGYDDYTIENIELSSKQTNKYYIFDPTKERSNVRVINQRLETQYIAQGTKFLLQKEYDSAIVEFNKAIAVNIMCDSAYYFKGQALIAQELYEQAYDSYFMAININEEFDQIYDDIRTYKLYERAKEPYGQVKYGFSNYRKFNPLLDDVSNLVFLGSISENSDRALLCYQRALKIDPNNTSAYYMLLYQYAQKRRGEFFELLQQYINTTDKYSDKICKMIKNTIPTHKSDKRSIIFINKLYDQYQYATRLYPNNYGFAEHLTLMAILYRESNSLTPEEITQSYNVSLQTSLQLIRIAQSDPTDERLPACYKRASFYYAKLGNEAMANKYTLLHEEASAKLSEQIALRTDEACLMEAREKVEQLEYEEAYKKYLESLEKSHNYIDEICDDLRRYNIYEVLKPRESRTYSYNELYKIDPSLSSNYSLVGSLMGKYSDQLPYYQKAIEIDPNNISAQYMMAYVCVKLKKSDEAVAALTKLIELTPNYSSDIVYMLHSLKHYDSALAQMAYQKYPEDLFYNYYYIKTLPATEKKERKYIHESYLKTVEKIAQADKNCSEFILRNFALDASQFLREMGDIKSAQKICQSIIDNELIETKTYLCNLYYELGRCYEELDDLDNARTYYHLSHNADKMNREARQAAERLPLAK